MAAKIRGQKWQFNYRGFDIYYSQSKDRFYNVPNENLINKDLATVDHYAVAENIEQAMSMIDDHFEVLEAMTGQDLQGSAV